MSVFMNKTECSSCLSNPTSLACDVCQNSCCKECMVYMDQNIFEFSDLLPKHILDKSMCPNCYHNEAHGIVEDYKMALEKAKDVDIFDLNQAKATYKMPRHEKPISVSDCDNREEVFMRLAFLATLQGFNTLLDVGVKSKKIELGGRYKKLIWSGKGTPLLR